MKKAAILVITILSIVFTHCKVTNVDDSREQVYDTIMYMPVFINPCNDSVDFISQFNAYNQLSLINDSGLSSPLKFDPYNIVSYKVSESGRYHLVEGKNYGDVLAEINIDLKKDTIRDTIVFLGIYVENSRYLKHRKYYSCKEYLNGHIVRYYSDSKVRFEGNFIDGAVTDSLVRYYINGNITSRLYIDSTDYYLEEYLLNGNPYSITVTRKQLGSEYSETYYLDGVLRELKRPFKKDILNLDLYSSEWVNEQIAKDSFSEAYYSFNPTKESFQFNSKGYLTYYEIEDSVYSFKLVIDNENIHMALRNKKYYRLISRQSIKGNTRLYSNINRKLITEFHTDTDKVLEKICYVSYNSDTISARYKLARGKWVEQKEEEE